MGKKPDVFKKISKIIYSIGNCFGPDQKIDFDKYKRDTLVTRNPWVTTGNYLREAIAQYYESHSELKNAGLHKPKGPKRS